MVSAVSAAHSAIDIQEQSYFSEQELVGVSNLLFRNTKQETIRHFRPGRPWNPTNAKIKILSSCGYKYFTNEYNDQNYDSKIPDFYFILYLSYHILNDIWVSVFKS